MDNFVGCLQACASTDGCVAVDYDGVICGFYATNDGDYYTGYQAATIQTELDTVRNGIEFITDTAMFYNYPSDALLVRTDTSDFGDCLDQCGNNPACNYVNYGAISSARSCELIGGGPYNLQNSGDYNAGAYITGRPTL